MTDTLEITVSLDSEAAHAYQRILDGLEQQHERTVGEYQADLSALLSVPVRSVSLRADGGRPTNVDVVVRRAPARGLRNVRFAARPPASSPRCTTITVYPHGSRRPGVAQRLLERLTF
mgnify:CR=1 FL=1